jgi:hypothetical protein
MGKTFTYKSNSQIISLCSVGAKRSLHFSDHRGKWAMRELLNSVPLVLTGVFIFHVPQTHHKLHFSSAKKGTPQYLLKDYPSWNS